MAEGIVVQHRGVDRLLAARGAMAYNYSASSQHAVVTAHRSNVAIITSRGGVGPSGRYALRYASASVDLSLAHQ